MINVFLRPMNVVGTGNSLRVVSAQAPRGSTSIWALFRFHRFPCDTKKTALVRPTGARSGKDQARPKEGQTSQTWQRKGQDFFSGKKIGFFVQTPKSGKPGRAKNSKKWKVV